MADEDHLLEPENACRNIKFYVIGMTEVKRRDEKSREKTEISSSAMGTRPDLWVGEKVYINSNMKNRILEVKGDNERIAVLKLKINKTIKLAILQVYALTSNASLEESIAFFSRLLDTYNSNNEKYTTVMGDFNAKIRQNEAKHLCLGNICKVNADGELLIDWANSLNLKITSTFFKKKLRKC